MDIVPINPVENRTNAIYILQFAKEKSCMLHKIQGE